MFFRIIITTPTDPNKPIQLFSPNLDSAKKELKKWADKGNHGRYRILEKVEKVVEEGEC